ncbi:ankyrin-3-like isoform X2 [Papaver somniferum]|nr:ankyrin-3-like isoform X2 [Papaver somniferum]XP_026422025.1 ankyrin-3-like isoform X2 [Papaver somniferum]
MAGHMNIVEYLLGKGADPKTSDPKGYSPWHCAAEKGYKDILTKLLSKGVDVNAACENGTPLANAAAHGKLEAIQILLDNNANPDLSSGRSFTPLTGSIVSGLPQSLRCVELLLEAGANPDGGSYGVTRLIAAASDGLTEIIKRLIQAGANPDVTNRYGLTPLEIAALNRCYNDVEILFPVTSRLPECVDWNIGGVIRHVQSDQAKEQRKLKVREKFDEAKLSGADAFKKQDYFEAMVRYSQANEIDPYDATILSNRSMCWARLKEGEEALEDANACISLRPDWPKAYYREGVAYNLLNKYTDARGAFLRGLKLSPDSQELKDAYREAIANSIK